MLDCRVSVTPVDREATGSSSSTSTLDTSSWVGLLQVPQVLLLGQLGLKATCGPSLNSDYVLMDKVKSVEKSLVPLSIVSCPIPRLGLHQFTQSCVHAVRPCLYNCSLYFQFFCYCEHGWFFISVSLCAFMFLLNRYMFTFSHSMTLSSWTGVRIREYILNSDCAYDCDYDYDCDCDTDYDCDCDTDCDCE